MERQTERQHQVHEQHDNTDECLHDLPKHHNIDADTLKPGKTRDYGVSVLQSKKTKTLEH